MTARFFPQGSPPSPPWRLSPTHFFPRPLKGGRLLCLAAIGKGWPGGQILTGSHELDSPLRRRLDPGSVAYSIPGKYLREHSGQSPCVNFASECWAI